jgi:hypothetical protein
MRGKYYYVEDHRVDYRMDGMNFFCFCFAVLFIYRHLCQSNSLCIADYVKILGTKANDGSDEKYNGHRAKSSE